MLQKPLTISALNRQVKFLLETNFGNTHVEGEISNLARPSSGHIYFTLKDSRAQIRCAMFKSQVARIQHDIKNGDNMLARGKLSLYEGRGDYQLIVTQLSLDGEGLLQQQFLQLKQQLTNEGLFDPQHKRPLPKHISTLAVVSSLNGAAFEDICSVIKRRWPLLKIKLFASSVQGIDAPKHLIGALTAAEADPQCDCILISRGGGSLEDLFCFNDEQLARTIFYCKKPIISGVGHEIDTTICDYVADVRAATPSAAAELITPDCEQTKQQLFQWQQYLTRSIMQKVSEHQHRLANLSQLLRSPSLNFQRAQQQVDHAVRSLHLASQHLISGNQQKLNQLNQQVSQQDPLQKIRLQQEQLKFLQATLINQYRHNNQNRHHQFKELLLKLDSLSPLNTLKRGYAITKTDNHVVTSITQLSTQQSIKTQFVDGEVISTINRINSKT